MALSPRELEELIVLSRQVELQYGLDTFTDAQIRETRRAMQRASREITRELHNRIATDRLTAWQADRAGALLNEADRLTQGMQTRLAQDINRTASSAGLSALREHNSILSFTGMVGGFNQVALSSAQFASFFRDTPLHGHTLQNWVNRAFTREMQTKIRNEINTGVFRGKGYPDLVKRVNTAFTNLTNREAVTLTRSYVQAANVKAMTAVYDANADIVQKVKWSAVLENGYRSSGRGTCLICAGLDGRVYPKDDHPECPIHPRCRCTLLPVTKTFRELGLDINEVKAVHRPYTIRQNKNIDAGGRRKIREVGFHQGDYGSWYKNQTDRTRINIVGPRRKEMLDRGDITFADLVNPRTGRVYRLQELDGNVMVNTPVGAPGAAQQLDEWGFRVGTKSNIFAEELLYNPLSGADIKALNWNSYGHTFAPIRQKLSKQGVLFKDGKGRWYTIKPNNIDDHAELGLKGLVKKLGGGKGPGPTPLPDPPVVKDFEAIKKKIRKTMNYKSGSKSEALLEGLFERPMSGKEIREFMDSNHDFPAVRKKLRDMGVIAKDSNNRWYVIELLEDGPSPPPPIPKPTPKPKPKPKKKPKKASPQYWEDKIEDLENKIEVMFDDGVVGAWGLSDDMAEQLLDDLDRYAFTNEVVTHAWTYNDAQKGILKKFRKVHDDILEAKSQLYKSLGPEARLAKRKELATKITEYYESHANHMISKSAKKTVATSSMINDTLNGTRSFPYKQLLDMERHGYRVKWHNFEWRYNQKYKNWEKYDRAYFNPRDNAATVFRNDKDISVVAHETSHGTDSFMSGRGREFGGFGKWKNTEYSKATEAHRYKQWYEGPKTGGKGTYNNGDGQYWYGNWVRDYEGRIYGSSSFGEQYWAMNNQRFYQSVEYYKDNMHRITKSVEELSTEAQTKIDKKLEWLQKKIAEKEEAYFEGKLSKSQLETYEKYFKNEVEKVKTKTTVQGGSVTKEELWEESKKYRGWSDSKRAYPEFSEWFENDYMKRQGISLETNFDG